MSSSRTAVPLTPVLSTGLVSVLFVRVCVAVSPTKLDVVAGRVSVTLPLKSL